MNILFYILIPVYRAEQYIDACIESVFSQDYENWQVVLVDDGSPDKAGEICDSYAKDSEGVHVIHQKNMGQLAARQAAIRYVLKQDGLDEKQTYILYLDSDDAFKPGALRTIRDTVVKTGGDLLFFGMDRVCEGKVISAYQHANEYAGEVTDKRKLYNLVFNSATYNPLCRKAVQLSLYEEMDYSQYYHIRHGEDLLESLSIYKKCRKAVFMHDSLYDYTVNPDSITQSVCYENFTVDSTVRARVLEFIKAENVMTESDIKNYLDYCRKLMGGMVRTVANFQVSYDKKKELFDKIHRDSYYSFLLSDAEKKRLLLRLLKNRRYHSIIWICKVRLSVGNLKHSVNKHIGG